MVSATLVPLAGANPARYFQLSMALAVLVGVDCILAGLCGAGFIANFLSRPILNGFLNGTGLTIIAGQLGKIFGFKMDRPQVTGFYSAKETGCLSQSLCMERLTSQAE